MTHCTVPDIASIVEKMMKGEKTTVKKMRFTILHLNLNDVELRLELLDKKDKVVVYLDYPRMREGETATLFDLHNLLEIRVVQGK